jgi:hypothetical protein
MQGRHIGREEVWLHLLLTTPQDGDERLTPVPGRFNPGKEHRYTYNRRLGGILVLAYPKQYVRIHLPPHSIGTAPALEKPNSYCSLGLVIATYCENDTRQPH